MSSPSSSGSLIAQTETVFPTITKFHLEKQHKQCGHLCFPSTTPHCCPCSDIRPHRVGDTYPIYVDGFGWSDTGTRDHGYCPVCNPKNYASWIKEIELKHIEKEKQKQALQVLLEKQNMELNDDILAIYRDIGDGVGRFVYSNGDEYEGEFLHGQRHGTGTMFYASDQSVYEGQWQHNQQHGHGMRNWGDGILYVGAWENNQMHGQGKYTLACGTIIEGRFENDEFAE